MGAVLAGGPGAVLSHRSAAALWGLLATSREAIDITVPGRSRRGRPGIAIHGVRHLPAADRTAHDGIAVTTVARTPLDLAATLHRGQLARAWEEAERLRLLDLRAVEGVLAAAARTQRGRGLLATLVAEHRDPVPATRSELERRLLHLCRDAGLPTPSVNVLVCGFEVDLCWSDRRLVVELDGHAFHRTRAAFERDRRRDAALQLAGYRVLRVTYRRLEAEPGAVAETIRRLLSRP